MIKIAKTAKIAISLPKENFERIEKIRKKLGLQRSAVIGKAIAFWLKHLEEEEMVRRYVEGYKKHPESEEEIEALAKMAAEAFEAEGLNEAW